MPDQNVKLEVSSSAWSRRVRGAKRCNVALLSFDCLGRGTMMLASKGETSIQSLVGLWERFRVVAFIFFRKLVLETSEDVAEWLLRFDICCGEIASFSHPDVHTLYAFKNFLEKFFTRTYKNYIHVIPTLWSRVRVNHDSRNHDGRKR